MAQEISTLGKEIVEGMRRNSRLAIAIGILVVITGGLAVASPLIAGLSATLVAGFMFLIAGIGHIVLAFKAGSFGKGLLAAVVGILTAVAGVLMISRPGMGLAALTIFLASYFLVAGIFEMVAAFEIKPSNGWGWTLFSGIVSTVLGFMIWGEFPISGVWAIGTIVGIRLLFSGFALIMLGSGSRRMLQEVMRKAA